MHDERVMWHALEALRGVASRGKGKKGCHRSNCGSVCLCPPCHARGALELGFEELSKRKEEEG